MNTVIDQLYALQGIEFQSADTSPEHEEKVRQLRETIPAPILGHYDRLLERGKKGVALVRNGVCGECHMRIAIGVVATLMRREDIQLCGSCGRYLYLPEQVAAPAPAPVAEPAPKRRKSKKMPNVV